jgi:hypothetical protein
VGNTKIGKGMKLEVVTEATVPAFGDAPSDSSMEKYRLRPSRTDGRWLRRYRRRWVGRTHDSL